MNRLHAPLCIALLFCSINLLAIDSGSPETRELLHALVLSEDREPAALLEALSETGDPFIKEFVESWRTGDVLQQTLPDGSTRILHRLKGVYQLLTTAEPVTLTPDAIASLEKMRPSRSLRRDLKPITDTIDLSSPDAQVRIDAALKLGLSKDPEYLPILERKLETQQDKRVRRAFEEAILLSLLDNFTSAEERVDSVVRLGELKSLRARDTLEGIRDDADTSGDEAMSAATRTALRKIEQHQALVEKFGNLFRGLSLGSVLLIVSFGLAITFGLMGIINMAHGEFIAIGGYTCYVVQNLFAQMFGTHGFGYEMFFFFSLPASFLVAALIGLVFEKSFIRFLYRRPLESLLATWGLSMIMQQTFRLIFGAANVQVNTPSILLGNYEVAGVSMSYARIFVIAFAMIICLLTWALLTRTNLGLYIRAVMQNRSMASSIGIPVARVNSITFAFGCGLAALAGAALSQLGNVGPSMGQAYIVDSFMVVVVGSVGNLLGAGVSAMGIGVVDQFLQPVMGPVMGKITVFTAIILFLQWKPGGIFPTKSRSLDD